MGAARTIPEGQTKYEVADVMMGRLRFRVAFDFRRRLLPTLIELCGIGMIVGGLWILNPIASVVVCGILMVIIAQGLSAGRGNQ